MEVVRMSQATDKDAIEAWILDRMPAEDREAAIEERVERDRSTLVRAWSGWAKGR